MARVISPFVKKGEYMMKRQNIKRTLTSLFVVLLLPILVAANITVCAASEITTVIACSDFQNSSGNDAGKQVVSSILSSIIESGITSADGFLCCGDYDYEYTETTQGIAALKEAVSGVVTENMVFVQGNHDSAPGTNGPSFSGNNDPAGQEYGVFVINEDDYMWYNSSEDTIKQTTRNLISYLNEKLAAGYEKPIFVMSHLPLNYNMRTYYDGDGKHANYIFNVLNEAGKKGLNIIFLFGHDHSNGWDDYLGGASVFLKKGDEILIAQNSSTVFETEELAFTYMNAGYIGYYIKANTGVDNVLTMTSFEISDNDVTIKRYDSDGLHNLKSAGVTNSFKGETGYEPDTTVYTSPVVVTLTKITDNTPIVEDFTKKPVEKYVRVTSLDELTDGESYLLVYNSTDDYIMNSKVVTISERTGFVLEKTSGFGSDVVYGKYSDKKWKFTKIADKWLIGKDGLNATLTYDSSNGKIAATLEENGSEFVIGGNADAYTFTSGSYSLNYNATRGIMNGFAGNPAEFYIYKTAPNVSPGLNLWTGTTQEYTFDKSTDLFDNEGVEYADTVGGADKDGKGDGIDPVDSTNYVVSLRQFGRTYQKNAVYDIEADRPVLLEFDYYSTNNEYIYVWVNEYTQNTSYYQRFKTGEEDRSLNIWNRKHQVVISNTGDIVNNVIVGGYATDWTYDLSIDNLSVIPYYKITYNSNGGEGSVPAEYFLADSFSEFNDGTGLTKPGYNFVGWSTEQNGTALSVLTPTHGNDITLYAVWEISDEDDVTINTITLLDKNYRVIEQIPKKQFITRVEVKNNRYADSFMVLVATYDEDGRLIKIYYDEKSAQLGKSVTFDAEIANTDSKVAKVKAMVFDTINSVSPLTEAVEIKKNQ